MKKSELNDEQLEQMLSQMPLIKDNRNSRDIYQNISLKLYKKKKKTWVVPSLATAAVALLLFILAPSLMNVGMSNSETALDQSADSNAEIAKESLPEGNQDKMMAIDNAEEEAGESRLFIANEQQAYAVRSVAEDEALLTYGVMLEGGNFPTIVSLVVKSDGSNLVEQLEQNIPLLNEKIRTSDWGMDEFPSHYFSDFTEVVQNDGTKIVKAAVDESIFSESFSPTESLSFLNALSSFRHLETDYRNVELFQGGKQGLIVGPTGNVENVDVEKDTKKGYLYYMREDSGYKILTPTVNNYDTIQEAIEAMKQSYESGAFTLHPTITESSRIKDIKENGTDLEITFYDDAALENSDTFILMVDAVMLTAKEFNFDTVTFTGNIDRIGEIPFGQPVPVPLAPNPIRLQ